MEEIKLGLAIPCCRDWKVAFGASLIGLVRHLSIHPVVKSFDINIMQGASVLPRARQLGIEWAKKIGATHLLFLDDDMLFPSTAVEQLLSHDKDIVACNYVSKATGKALVHGVDGKMIPSSDRAGLEEVGWVGFGAILIRLSAIQNIAAPLFETSWLEDKGDFIGEDFYFCKKVREHGIKIHCDHDLSKKVGHIGDYSFGFPQPEKIGEAA